MKTFLTRLIWLLVLAAAAYLLWQQRDRLAGLSNNNLRIQGDWYLMEMDFKGVVPYTFSEKFITRDGIEWGSYELRTNTRLEVTVGTEMTEYELSFPDDQNMVWSVEVDGKWVRAERWRR
jgi:hypothetical protein